MSNSTQYLIDSVDPFIGTEAVDLPKPDGLASTWFYLKAQIGNHHPGACLPFSPVSACPYSGAYVTGYGVYGVNTHGDPPKIYKGKKAFGISHVHHSGTGYIDRFYNFFLTIPSRGGTPSVPSVDLEQSDPFSLTDENASPGYYSGRLDEIDVEFELTVGERSAAHRYNFGEYRIAMDVDGDATAPSGTLIIDVTNEGLAPKKTQTRASRAVVEILRNGVCTGMAELHNIPWYFAFVCPNKNVETILWQGTETETKQDAKGLLPVKHIIGAKRIKLTEEDCRKERAGILFKSPKNRSLELYVGLSIESEKAALEAAEKAAAHGFEKLHEDANDSWEGHLNRIKVHGGPEKTRKMFYTALYHSFAKPVETEPTNFLWKDGPVLYCDFATMWDQYKTHHPLILTLNPERIGPIVSSCRMVEEAVGYFPPGLIFHDNYGKFFDQSRALCHVTLWDAYQRWKALRNFKDSAVSDDVDWNGLLDAMLRALEKDAATVEPGKKQSYSHMLDIGYGAYCTASLAKELGQKDAEKKARGYWNVWREAFDDATGLMKEAEYYEAGNVSYSFRLLHDMESRIGLSGGKESFLKQLDSFFGYGADPIQQLGDPPWEPARSKGQALGRFDGVNNEVTLETPYAYEYVGRPDRTAEVVAAVMKYHYSDSRGGIPGNDDSGALASWYVWNAVGLFPVPGQGIYFIGSPLFTEVEIKTGDNLFRISARRRSDESIYLASVTLNHHRLNRAFLTYDEVLAGGVLEIEMTDQPGVFVPEVLPPSYR